MLLKTINLLLTQVSIDICTLSEKQDKCKTLCYKSGSSPEKRCPVNAFLDADGDCQVCAKNHRVDVKTKRCVPCPKNAISEGGLSTTCRKCPGGQVGGG